MPSVGDKFQYLISHNAGQRFNSTFIVDEMNEVISFYFKWDNIKSTQGKWTEKESDVHQLIIDLGTFNPKNNAQMVYLQPMVFKQLKTKKNIKIIIDGQELDFFYDDLLNYNLPIEGANLSTNKIVASTSDKRWIIHILNNPKFPLITAIIGRFSWQLTTIVPMPMIPVTKALIGQNINSRKPEIFKNYVKETCESLEVSYTDNHRNIVFNEFFCPIVGVRFSLKNDTIIGLKLVSNTHVEEGYQWQTYKGYIWGLFGLGESKKSIEKSLGKPVVDKRGRNFYPDLGFYLKYNFEGILEEVEYEFQKF